MRSRREAILLLATTGGLTAVTILLRAAAAFGAGFESSKPQPQIAEVVPPPAPSLLGEGELAAKAVQYKSVSKTENMCALSQNFTPLPAPLKGTGTCAKIIGKRVNEKGICINFAARKA